MVQKTSWFKDLQKEERNMIHCKNILELQDGEKKVSPIKLLPKRVI